MRLNALACAVFLTSPGLVLGQETRVVNPNPQDSPAASYRIYKPIGKPEGLLVLIPGGAATYDEFTAKGSTPSILPRKLANHRIVTIVPGGGPYSHWLEDGWLKQMDFILAETLTTYGIPDDRVVVGGFSAGGTAAVRYAEYCAERRSRAGVQIQGVFAVDHLWTSAVSGAGKPWQSAAGRTRVL